MRNNTVKRSILLDQDSFREAFEQNFEAICEFLNYYTHDESTIKDVVQDVFLKLWEDRENLEITYMKTYLYTAARNRMLNRLRDDQNRELLLKKWAVQEKVEVSSQECIDMDEFKETLQRAVDMLPVKHKEIYELNRQEKLTYNQIAQKMNIPIKTVETRMSMALKRIRGYLSIFYKKEGKA